MLRNDLLHGYDTLQFLITYAFTKTLQDLTSVNISKRKSSGIFFIYTGHIVSKSVVVLMFARLPLSSVQITPIF